MEQLPPVERPRSETCRRALHNLEKSLDESRLAKGNAFYRKPRTDVEKQWLLQNRSAEAVHWNLLTDLKREHLQFAPQRFERVIVEENH